MAARTLKGDWREIEDPKDLAVHVKGTVTLYQELGDPIEVHEAILQGVYHSSGPPPDVEGQQLRP